MMLRKDNVAPEAQSGQERRLHLLDGAQLTPEQQERIDSASERDNAAMRLAMEKWNAVKWRMTFLAELRANTRACNRNAEAVDRLIGTLGGEDWDGGDA